jgi:hypothetical protein
MPAAALVDVSCQLELVPCFCNLLNAFVSTLDSFGRAAASFELANPPTLTGIAG